MRMSIQGRVILPSATAADFNFAGEKFVRPARTFSTLSLPTQLVDAFRPSIVMHTEALGH